MTAPPPSDVPTLLAGRYEIERELGHGASSFVYLAHDRTHDRRVAVKVLRRELARSVGAERFLREVHVTARLQHPRIVSVLDAGAAGDQLFFVAPYMEGGTLRERLLRERQLPIGVAVAIAHAVATALDYAHAHALVHRDVKPENIFFAGDEACLGDFGIARALDDAAPSTTSTGIVRGTPAYMSPEQASGQHDLDGRSDLYSLGCVLYEMLAGVPPFTGPTQQAVIAQRFTHPPEPLDRYRATVPPELDDIVQRTLALAPADRFPHAHALAVALASTGLAQSTGAPAARLTTAPPRASDRRPRRTVVGATMVAVAAVALFAWDRTRDGAGAAGQRTRATAALPLAVRVSAAGTGDGTGDAALGARVARALRAELAGWSDIRLVERSGRGTMSIAVSAVPLGDSARVLVDLDAEGRAGPRLVRVVPLRAVDAATTVAPLARQVLGGADAAAAPGVETMPGRSLVALRAYLRGWNALRAGRLDSAATAFRAARGVDPTFARAALWAAQSGAWSAPRDSRSWKGDAEGAASSPLGGADSALATALHAMSMRDYAAACTAFRDVTERDGASFAGWFGLGECARLDSVVVRTTRGWQFRSSHWAALASYAEAIERAPTAELLGALFPRIMRTTGASGSGARHGRSNDATAAPFSALPSLDHDTLAYLPVPRAAFFGLGAGAVPASYALAFRRGRDVALDLTARWLRRFPESSDAWLQRSLALELSGRIGDGPTERSASAALERAASGARTPLARTRIAVARVRLALRRSDFATAGRTVRAVLSAPLPTDSASRAMLAPLAALVGDVAMTERTFVADADQTPGALPATLGDSLRAFGIRATLGACDELPARRDALETMFRVAFAPAELRTQRERLLLPVYRDAVPCLGPSSIAEFASDRPMDGVFHALASRDRAGARRILASLRAHRTGANTGGITWDYLFTESWALVQVGDTTAAVAQLGAALRDLASMSLFTLERPEQAAGLRRALQLLTTLGSTDQPAKEAVEWSSKSQALSLSPPTSRDDR